MSMPDRNVLKAACETIYRAWLPLIGEAGAREQAEAFASRFQINKESADAAA